MAMYQSTVNNDVPTTLSENINTSGPSTYTNDVLRDRKNSAKPVSRSGSVATSTVEVVQQSEGVIRKPDTHFWDFGSLYLENKGAVARDHLASERTFLAWLRTSLAFASIGVGVTQLFKLSSSSDTEPNEIKKFAKPLGLLFILTSILTLFFGVIRYFLVQRLLIEGIFPASRAFIGILLGLVFVLTALTMGIVSLNIT